MTKGTMTAQRMKYLQEQHWKCRSELQEKPEKAVSHFFGTRQLSWIPDFVLDANRPVSPDLRTRRLWTKSIENESTEDLESLQDDGFVLSEVASCATTVAEANNMEDSLSINLKGFYDHPSQVNFVVFLLSGFHQGLIPPFLLRIWNLLLPFDADHPSRYQRRRTTCKLRAILSSWPFHRHILTMRGIALGARTGLQRSHTPPPAANPARTRPRPPFLAHAGSLQGPLKHKPRSAESWRGRRHLRRCISRRRTGRTKLRRQDRQRGPCRTGRTGPNRGVTCTT
jgi:hypothetical protein